jgi:hypothetical protein
MESSRTAADHQTFTLGWVKSPGPLWDTIGSVTLPSRPTTLGEARGGLEMIGEDAPTTHWLQTWAESPGEERNIVLRLPDGWFELSAATIALVLGAGGHYLIRFDRRSLVAGPAA